jgi:hypothetical protein
MGSVLWPAARHGTVAADRLTNPPLVDDRAFVCWRKLAASLPEDFGNPRAFRSSSHHAGRVTSEDGDPRTKGGRGGLVLTGGPLSWSAASVSGGRLDLGVAALPCLARPDSDPRSSRRSGPGWSAVPTSRRLKAVSALPMVAGARSGLRLSGSSGASTTSGEALPARPACPCGWTAGASWCQLRAVSCSRLEAGFPGAVVDGWG